MEESILKCVKKVLGIGPDDTSFDLDVIIHINSVFSTLQQVGVGLPEGFSIEDENVEWADYIAGFPEFEPQLGLIKTCVYLRVRMLFDPPTTSYHIAAMEKQIAEHEYRLSITREEAQWTDPLTGLAPVPETVDGGDAL